jgi:proteasome accessory factor B
MSGGPPKQLSSSERQPKGYVPRRRGVVEEMSRARTERLLNLVICLLAARRYLSKDEIRSLVPGYAESDEAFERAFERDKEALREMGVPVRTGSNSAWFEDEVGYRIPREAYELPGVSFTRDEMAVLALAARAWQQAALAGAASTALLKLQAYGVETDDLTVAGIDPRVDTNEAAFLPLVRATRERRAVAFRYRRGGEVGGEERDVEPWGLVAWHGHWYLVGHDRAREATRVFRLSRIAGEVRPTGRPGEVTVPAGVDLRAVVERLGSAPVRGTARVRLRNGAGGFLRRRATEVTPDAPGWDVASVPYADAEQLADDVAGLGPDAVVVDPADARDAVVRRLRAVLVHAEAPGASPRSDRAGATP